MRIGIDCNGKEWQESELKMKPDKDLTGRVFGELTVQFRVQNDRQGLSQWLARCVCGNDVVIRGSSLRTGHTKSCGCAQAAIVSGKLTKAFKPGEQIGYWTVMYKANGYLGKGAYWHCKCKCGIEKDVEAEHLRNSTSLSCGCLQKEATRNRIKDLSGQRFGHWTVLKIADEQVANEVMWTCVCDCGTIKIVSGHALKRGSSTSCGCVVSVGEANIMQILNEANITYVHNRGYFQDLIGLGGHTLRYDFVLLNDDVPYRLIEFDGPQHDEPCVWFGEDSFERTKQHDEIKNQYSISHNIPLVRIPYSKRDFMTLDDLLGDKYLIKGEM